MRERRRKRRRRLRSRSSGAVPEGEEGEGSWSRACEGSGGELAGVRSVMRERRRKGKQGRS